MGNLDSQYQYVDRFVSFLDQVSGEVQAAALPFVVTSATTITLVGSLDDVSVGDYMVMGKNSLMTVDIPEECEPYLMDYVAQRIVGRNNYTEDWNKMNFWTSEERGQIISIFADASQAQVRAPITDTDYMEV